MKLQQLFERKRKKRKKLPDPWFFGGFGLTTHDIDGGEGGAMSEEVDDWEAEEEPEQWTSFKVQPREGSSGWRSFADESQVFDLAFGVGKWGLSGIPNKGTFKRMMGISEHITFSEFVDLLESDQGQNKNDRAERAMVHRMLDALMQKKLIKGGRSEANLELMYDFLESDWGGRLWDKYYEAFKEYQPDFEGPRSKQKMSGFHKDTVAWYNKWKNNAKLPDDVAPLPKLHEEAQ